MKDIAIVDQEFLLLLFLNHLFLYGLFLQVMDPVNLPGVQLSRRTQMEDLQQLWHLDP